MNAASVWLQLFNSFGTTALFIIGLMAMAFGGGLWWAERINRKRRIRRRAIPKEWPVTTRRITANTERSVWVWLRETFPEYFVLPKLAITRFTTPTSHAQAQQWFNILGSIYCAFTICDSKGEVVGCVDIVTGSHNLWRGNRQLKQSLLSQCDIGYWVVTPAALPEREAIRAEFLGDNLANSVTVESVSPVDSQPQGDATMTATLQRAEEQLRETLIDRRRHRDQRAAANDDKTRAAKDFLGSATFSDTELMGDNSFLMSLHEEEDEHTVHGLLARQG